MGRDRSNRIALDVGVRRSGGSNWAGLAVGCFVCDSRSSRLVQRTVHGSEAMGRNQSKQGGTEVRGVDVLKQAVHTSVTWLGGDSILHQAAQDERDPKQCVGVQN